MHAICRRYVDLALAGADLSGLSSLTIDETSYRRGHSYLTLVADADARKVVFVSKGRGADNIAGFVQHLRTHNGAADNITIACLARPNPTTPSATGEVRSPCRSGLVARFE